MFAKGISAVKTMQESYRDPKSAYGEISTAGNTSAINQQKKSVPKK